MKKFNYNGNGILAFTHQEIDYVIHESGPHNLPEESDIVKSLEAQKLLLEVQPPAPRQTRTSALALAFIELS